MWQYSSSGSVPGISGAVDMDRLYVSLGVAQATPLITEVDIVPQPGQTWMEADPRAWPAGIAPLLYRTRQGEFLNEVAQAVGIPVAELVAVGSWRDAQGNLHRFSVAEPNNAQDFPPAGTDVAYGSARYGAGH